MPPTSMMIKPVSGRCNLRCAYCFYADETGKRTVADYGVMSDEVMDSLVRQTLRATALQCSFAFQGGEPTLAGLDYYRQFTECVERYRSPQLKINYSIQTNGTLLDGEWADFLRDRGFLVGLSLDGIRSTHDLYRKDASGRGTFDRVEAAADLLSEHGVDYNILTVVTPAVARNIGEIFDRYAARGYFYQQYIPCMDGLGEQRGQESWSLSGEDYGYFLKTLFDRWYAALESGAYYSVRYFDNIVRMAFGQYPEQCSLAGHCSEQYLVEADGTVFPCDFYAVDEYCLGNVMTDGLAQIDLNREKSGFIEGSYAIPSECRACVWYRLCRNGCRRDRAMDEGVLGKTVYCEANRAFFDYAIERIGNVFNLIHKLESS